MQIPLPPVTDIKFLLLHFTGVTLPGSNRIEVVLGPAGSDIDTFTSADGGVFWTRPINTKALAGAPVVVRYITNGASTGQAQIDYLGVGERHAGYQPPWPAAPAGFSNVDPFFTGAYVEPTYDPYWSCTTNPNWENTACVTDSNDVRARVARSVGMIITPEKTSPYDNPLDPNFGVLTISTCSVTLVDANIVMFAGHCFDFDEDALSSSVTFDYETDCNGNQIPQHTAKFYKVDKVIAHQYDPSDTTGRDWAILRLAQAPAGVPVVQLRPDLPGVGEQIFGVHHPNAAVKKLSAPHSSFLTILSSNELSITVPTNFHVSGGSSGSGLFDTAGRLLGVLSKGPPCGPIGYYPVFNILAHLAPVPPNPSTRDVMIVFDRSGSMSELDSTKRTKIDVARDAVSLFVQLIKSGVGNRVGLVSFSTQASSPVDFALTSIDATSKETLIGAAPFAGGKVGALVPFGATSIGDGLAKALVQLPAGPAGSNPRAILLMTDGMENTPPKIADGQPPDSAFSGIDVHAVGFGTPANLDSNLLTKFTAKHGGMYTGAETGVSLMKFFSHAFGNIFETGILQDPEFDLPSNQDNAPPLTFNVCHEDGITIAVGWDNIQGTLLANLTTPNGIVIGSRSANVESTSGRSWTFLRVPLPYSGEQAGRWNITVYRPPPTSPPIIPRFLRSMIRQLPPPPALHYFVNIIPTGGPILSKAWDNRTYYTGDTINPMVFFHFADGSWPGHAEIDLTLSRPNASVGTILSKSGLQAPGSPSGDVIPPRQATLGDLGTLITQVEEKFELSNDPANAGGYFEDTGLFGKILNGTLTVEGQYLFHFVARTTDPCLATRELLWSLHIDVGIDAHSTPITVTITGTDGNGQSTGVIVITPQDPYGNLLGPGRGDGVTWTGSTGTTITGPVADNGNGTYTIPITYNPSSGSPPGVVVLQPGRPPVTIQQPNGFCQLCIPYPGQNKCDATTSCSSTPFGTMCSCRPGYKANAAAGDGSTHWRLKWPVAGHEHRVYVRPGVVCDTLCDKWWLGPDSCAEVGVRAC